MNLFEKLVPHLILVAALLPTVLLLVAVMVSLARPDPLITDELPIQAAAACESCNAPSPD